MQETFTVDELTSFGRYLLSKERERSLNDIEGCRDRWREVYGSDFENWKVRQEANQLEDSRVSN
jgi:hypothetical protein